MVDTPIWRKPLDDVLASVAALDPVLNHIDGADLSGVVGQLRGANRAIWFMVNELEAGRARYLYDSARLLRVLATNADPEGGPGVLVELVENGVLTLNVKAMLMHAEKQGIDVTEYLDIDKEADDGPL